MLAALLIAVDPDGYTYVLKERCIPNLTLREAAKEIAGFCEGETVEFAVASPDLWNRRQDSGKSGFEIMQAVNGMPPMIAADDRRIPGWRVLREYLNVSEGTPRLRICKCCTELIKCIPALLCDPNRPEDASG
jgi:phage terminase large subunit